MGNILGVIIGGIILLMIVAFIFVIIRTGSPPNVPPPDPLPNPVGFMFQCKDYQCAPGLSCDDVHGVCKIADGDICRSGYDCTVESYCSSPGFGTGVCTDVPPAIVTGFVGSPCPCPQTMTCVQTEFFVYPICKLKPGQPCQIGSECLSGICNTDTLQCTAGNPPGTPCMLNSDCTSGFDCSLGFCQPLGTTTGSQNAYCGVAPCNPGLSCEAGRCKAALSGLGETCSDTLCSHILHCLGTGNAATCKFDYPDPNVCPCISGYACVSGQCIAPVMLPCTENAQCQNSSSGIGGSCGDNKFVYKLSFTTPSGVSDSPFAVAGSLDMTMIPVSGSNLTSSIGIGGVSKMTGFSSGSTDTIYLVSSNGVIAMDGSILIPGNIGPSSGNPNTRFLIDAQITGVGAGYVAFAEVRPDSSTEFTLYRFNGGILFPFNVTNSIPGTQFIDGNAIDIRHVSVSINSDLLIVDGSNRILILPNGMTNWQILNDTSTGAPLPMSVLANYYSDGTSPPTTGVCTGTCPSYYNVSYVSSTGPNSSPLRFNGDVQGALYPVDRLGTQTYEVTDYSIYSDPVDGIILGYLMMITQTFGPNAGYNLFMGTSGSINVLPGYFDARTKVLSLVNSAYVYADSTCMFG